jgi:hypothetical protein
MMGLRMLRRMIGRTLHDLALCIEPQIFANLGAAASVVMPADHGFLLTNWVNNTDLQELVDPDQKNVGQSFVRLRARAPSRNCFP